MYESYLVPYSSFTLYGDYMPTEDGHYVDIWRYFYDNVLKKYIGSEIPEADWPKFEQFAETVAADTSHPVVKDTCDYVQFGSNTWPHFKEVAPRYLERFATTSIVEKKNVNWFYDRSIRRQEHVETLHIPNYDVFFYLLTHRDIAKTIVPSDIEALTSFNYGSLYGFDIERESVESSVSATPSGTLCEALRKKDRSQCHNIARHTCNGKFYCGVHYKPNQ